MQSMGCRIKALRKKELLTQKDFAKRLLISQSYLSGLENNNEVPTDKLLKLICLEFGVNESWIQSGLGVIYDEVYENDKVNLVEISNDALLDVMKLLSTQSNVEYGFYAYTLAEIADILKSGNALEENDKIVYLELIQNFIAEFGRMISYIFAPHISVSKDVVDNYHKVITEQIEAITKLLQSKSE